MSRSRVFISFDYDCDAELKDALVGQARMDDSPFEIADHSIKEESPTWQAEARARIQRAEQVIVICGTQTHRASGVTEEIRIAKSENRPYFLLAGRADHSRHPHGAESDTMYQWTWPNLKALIAGAR